MGRVKIISVPLLVAVLSGNRWLLQDYLDSINDNRIY
jgi:hypothetical protein